MPPLQTYWTEPSGLVTVSVRIYEEGACPLPGNAGYHDAMQLIHAAEPAENWVDRDPDGFAHVRSHLVPANEPRWPRLCQCGFAFTAAATRQVWADELYTGSPGGALRALRHLEPGASYNAWWIAKYRPMPDGMSLVVICPDGHPWSIDERASNCTMPDDHEHRCWCRHGDPRQANITVNKAGKTCGAGGGSILTPRYHGMLTNGVLSEC